MQIRGRYYVDPPPRGDAARRGARRGDDLDSPPPREGHQPYGHPRAATRYERADSSAFATAADTNAELFRFSGRPDSITLSAQAFGVIFTLVDFLGRAITEIHVPAGGTQETYLAADRVLLRNAVAGSNGVGMAVGKWAERYESN